VTRKARLKDHARQIRVHLQALGPRPIGSSLHRPRSSPSSSSRRDLFSAAWNIPLPDRVRRGSAVILATPTTLIASSGRRLGCARRNWRKRRGDQPPGDALRAYRNDEATSPVSKESGQRGGGVQQDVGSFESRVLVTAADSGISAPRRTGRSIPWRG